LAQVFSLVAQGAQDGPAGNMDLAVRTSADPLSLAAALREQVKELDKDQAVADLRSLGEVVSASIAQPPLNTSLLAGFATLALVLASTGIYGVISCSVAQRTREIGIRMAIGASRGTVLRMVVGEGLALSLAGLGIGLVAAFALTHLMASLLYGVTPSDPATFTAVSLIFAMVASLASYIPARRATKVSPFDALRYE
jgi:ABC-type antimicrobial peptide transport system permease subunit